MTDSNELKQLVKYSKTLKILYVEDSLEATEQALKLFNNFFVDITIAIDGQDGLDKFKSCGDKPYDLIITDLNMPVMCGLDMIKNIRLTNHDIDIVVISAHNESHFKEDAKKLGISSYIAKPVGLDSIIDIIKLTKK